MNTMRNNSQRVKEDYVNEAVPPLIPQKPPVPIEQGFVSNV